MLLIFKILVSFAKLEPPLYCRFVCNSWAKCVVGVASRLRCFMTPFELKIFCCEDVTQMPANLTHEAWKKVAIRWWRCGLVQFAFLWPLEPEVELDLAPHSCRPMAHRLQLRLLTWDVKDTLLKLRQPIGEEYASKARAHGLEVEALALGQAFGQAYRAQSHSFPNYGLSQGLTSYQWWLDVVLQTFHLAGIRDAQAVAPIADELYKDLSRPCAWQVLEGAEATLRGCRERGLRLAVVSNFDRRLEDILVGLGLREHFDFLLTSEATGWPKPDPRIFHEALRLAHVEPAVAVHIGDSYHCDYKGAQAVGMHSFLVVGPEPLDPAVKDSVPQEHILPSLSHLLPALDRLEGSPPEV